MQKLTFYSCIPFFSLAISAQFKPNYFVVQYLKVHPSMDNEYLELETGVWKKMQQARIDAGVLDAWYFFRVISPSGTKTEYNYVTVLQYDTAEKLAGHFESYGVDYTTLLDAEEIAFALKTPEIRDLVYEEVWTTADQIMKKNASKMYRFQVFNAMSLNEGITEEEYKGLETKYWKPMHISRINTNRMHGWAMINMMIPGGTERAYSWATIDFYDRFIDIMTNNDDILKKLYGDKEMVKITEQTLATRDLLRTEVRELLDYAEKN